MADEFPGGGNMIDGSWWNIYNSSKPLFPLITASSSSPCSFTSWKIDGLMDPTTRSYCEEGKDVSDHHHHFHHQQLQKPKQSQLSSSSPQMMGFGLSSSSASSNWNNQNNHTVYGSHDSSFHSVLEEEVDNIISCCNSQIHKDWSPIKKTQVSSINGSFWNINSSPEELALHNVMPPHVFVSPPSPQAQYDQSHTNFEATPNGSSLILTKQHKREEDQDLALGSDGEPLFKRPRIESPMPTFKVRKDKLGDRITALQQLVSPFGKTDTASVLHDAIDYIKYLHEQVSILSAPYLNNGRIKHHQVKISEGVNNQDLKSQGLCLVPLSNTLPLANYEMDADQFLPPTYASSVMNHKHI